MKPLTLMLISNFIICSCIAQADFFVLKKHNRTIKRYYKGTLIEFYDKQDQLTSGVIDHCKNDSIFLKLRKEVSKPSYLGNVTDWAFYDRIAISIHDIAIIYKKRAITLAGVGNGVVKLVILAGSIWGVNKIQTDNNTAYAVGYGASIAVQFLMWKAKIFHSYKPTGYHIGKKYKLVYINISK